MANYFKIFYSWQSDLPGNNTRNFISSAIDAAAKFLANTVTVIPDRDTKGEIGSPNIEEIIFGKIDECDLFIADISIVAKYTDCDGIEKCTPNPNVLVELGYAVKVLGWENVICFLNTDYGKESDLPFDLNHHRVTGYSLENEARADIKKSLRDIISSTVMTIMENGIRPKGKFASHIVGSYDYETKTITEKIKPFDIQNCNFAIAYKEYLLSNARKYLNEVKVIKLPHNIKVTEDFVENTGERREIKESSNKAKEMDYHKGLVPSFDLFHYKPVEIAESERQMLRDKVKEYFGLNIDDEFFYLANLEVQTTSIIGMGRQYRGVKDAEKKYSLIQDCLHQFTKLETFQMYLKTFEGMLFFPLAIWNRTVTTDSDVTISIIVDSNTAEVVIPDKTLIYQDVAEAAGLIYKKHFVEALLKMPDTTDIFDGSDYEPSISAEMRTQMIGSFIDPFGYLNEPTYDIDDYVDEIKKYVASPIETSYNEFDFHNRKLRPNEKNWLGKGILLRQKAEKIVMVYKITSDYSDGGIVGILEYAESED